MGKLFLYLSMSCFVLVIGVTCWYAFNLLVDSEAEKNFKAIAWIVCQGLAIFFLVLYLKKSNKKQQNRSGG